MVGNRDFLVLIPEDLIDDDDENFPILNSSMMIAMILALSYNILKTTYSYIFT